MYFTKITNSKLKGFSLAEVLISILIIAIMLALAIPVLTKKDSKSSAKINGGSRIFTFQSQSDTSSFPCYLTTLSSSGVTTVKDTTGKCQIYTFTVPNGVHKINLTLVAGGGGGGGAAGGTVLKKEYDSSNSYDLELLHSRTKKVVIDYLIASGGINSSLLSTITYTTLDGTTTTSTSVIDNLSRTGRVSITGDGYKTISGFMTYSGGNSGTAITGHELPNDFLNLDYEPDFLTEKDNDDSSLNVSYITKTDLSTFSSVDAAYCTSWSLGACSNSSSVNLYTALNFDGYGLLFKSGASGSEVYSAVYLSDGSNSDSTAGCFSTSNGTNEIVTNSTTTISLSSDAIANSLCKLTDKSFRPSVAGSTDFIEGDIGSGYVLYGGEGGSIPGFGNKGKGGKTTGAIFSCGTSDTCTISSSDNNYNTISAETSVDNAYGKITAYIDNPGGVGGGGAGGTAIKINDFPVTPGETYTVSVGAGGAGGVAGTSGIITNNSNSYSYIEPKAGGNGAGGSSTAIYDSNGNLVLMVAGGVGGYGGKINDSAYNDFIGLIADAAANDTIISSFTSYTPIPDLPDAARNVPAVLINSDYLSTIKSLFDTSITASLDEDTTRITFDTTGSSIRLVSKFMDNDSHSGISPYSELNKNVADIAIKSSDTPDYNSSNDIYTGGFSNFNTSATALSDLSSSKTIYYNGVSNLYPYLGFYQRYVVNNELAYAGGLGGFSGLGGKAGCGGLFVGNKNGLDVNGSENEAFNNTFTINTAANGYTAYNINDYYGNCTTSNSNGQTADFIAPSYIPAAGEKLGQAGGGGGGGGWSSSFGAGKGGDGQNGYVMITWRY